MMPARGGNCVRRPSWIWCVLAGIALSIAAGPASAQQSQDERARFHFEVGRTYFDEGNYERAVEEWQRSYELSQRPELLLNIVTTLERLGRYGDAADGLERYLETTT